jgi:hypothetical protein
MQVQAMCFFSLAYKRSCDWLLTLELAASRAYRFAR